MDRENEQPKVDQKNDDEQETPLSEEALSNISGGRGEVRDFHDRYAN
jgi:hypothetical protein